MSETTIEWTKRPSTIGVTWNVTTGCNKVDRGCKHCYAEAMHRRLRAMGLPKYANDFLAGAVPWPAALREPLRWKKPRTVFVNSMSDLFHINVENNFLIDVFEVIKATPQHTYLVLTKRPERALHFEDWMTACDPAWEWPPNVWLGTSINDQAAAELRIPRLLACRARLHFVSYEPATGHADLRPWLYHDVTRDLAGGLLSHFAKLDWVIMGGESGPKAEPMRVEWAAHVRNACLHAKVPFFFKQWGLWHPFDFRPVEDKIYNVKRFADGGTPMYRASDKSFNLLCGEQHQNFPE